MITRRDFLKTTSTSIAAAGPLATLASAAPTDARSAELWIQRAVKPLVISDYSGFEFKNGGKENAVPQHEVQPAMPSAPPDRAVGY